MLKFNDKNKANIEGVIAKIYLDKDKNGKEFCKLIIESIKYVADKSLITSVKCYFYNKPYEYFKSNDFKIGDYVNIIGELQNRDDNIIIFTHKIIKL